MTRQTNPFVRLGGSPAGILRLSTLTLAAILATGGIAAMAQTQADAAKPEAAKAAKAEKKPANPSPAPAERTIGKYHVHQTVELGGHMVENKSGSRAMWSTMVNQSSGFRMLDHSLQMHSVDPSKTPFFDSLSTSSFGYGGDANNVSTLNLSKGRFYSFAGMFRRDRNYFDYNLFTNSLLSTATAATPALVSEPDTLHLFNTVRRNTDTMLTLFPLARIHVRAGYNHNTHEGPAFSTLHGGGDVPLAQWFRNSLDTYTGGVDVELFKRTTVSYDQYYARYKGDTTFQLAPTPFKLSNGTPVSLGVDVLTGPTVTCGAGANKTENVINGIANPFCSGTTTQSETAPTRTTFPTEQFRFSSHYWDKVAMNGRATYSGGVSNVNSFNETFIGWLSRTTTRESILTGAGAGGRFAHNKRVNINVNYGIEAEVNEFLSFTDTVTYWAFRIPTSTDYTQTVVTGPAATTSMLTPLTSGTLTTTPTTTTDSGALNQQNAGNTAMAILTLDPRFKFSAGWRYNNREIKFNDDPTMAWHQNWLLLGSVYQPLPGWRITLNYDQMYAKAANSNTTSTTYTREAPNKANRFRGRVSAKAANWLNVTVAGNGYWAKNKDPLVNHEDHNWDVSFASQIVVNSKLNFDVAVSHDNVYSKTDLCYMYSLATAPYGDPGSQGTCLQTADNPSGTLPTAPATSQLRLGNGYYSAPSTFFSTNINYAPVRKVNLSGGVRMTDLTGNAEFLNPLQAPGALVSTTWEPYADAQLKIAPEWTWHGNWVRHGYYETDGGPASRSFEGDVISLGVKYSF